MKLDTVEAERAEGHCVMQPWQGDSSVTIDRFDARYALLSRKLFYPCFLLCMFFHSIGPNGKWRKVNNWCFFKTFFGSY